MSRKKRQERSAQTQMHTRQEHALRETVPKIEKAGAGRWLGHSTQLDVGTYKTCPSH